jgi:hypothetical protein
MGGIAIGEAVGKYGNYSLRNPIVTVGPGEMGAFGIKDLQSPLMSPAEAAAEAAGAKGPIGPDGRAYSVAFSMQLANDDVAAREKVHFNRGNAALDAAMNADPEFRAMMEQFSQGVSERVSSVGGRQNPEGWTWHHAQDYGMLELVRTVDHTASMYQDAFHPGGTGGYADWAVPAGAPPRRR